MLYVTQEILLALSITGPSSEHMNTGVLFNQAQRQVTVQTTYS